MFSILYDRSRFYLESLSRYKTSKFFIHFFMMDFVYGSHYIVFHLEKK